MLIRWTALEDKSSWIKLAQSVSLIFGNPTMATDKEFDEFMERKISRFEALIAIDRMSKQCLGIISFSRKSNHISWFAVNEDYRGKGIGIRLLNTALRQLDTTKIITVETFREDNLDGIAARAIFQKAGFHIVDSTITDQLGNPRCKMVLMPKDSKRGASFHYNYTNYDKYSQIENCLFCNHVPAPDSIVTITELEYSVVAAEKNAQGRLFGKCHLIIKNHYVNFEDIAEEDRNGFMSEIQQVGRALRKVTGAIKINYEIHSNSVPHIHCHLFPRYLDDDFPSSPIDYRVTQPSPYESEEEFDWFVERMKDELINK